MVVITGLTFLLGGQGSVVLGSQYLPSGVTAILWSTVPLWVLLIEYFFLKKRPAVLSVIGLCAGFIGLLFLVMPSLQNGEIELVGIIFIIAGALCWAIGSVYSKSVDMRNDAVFVTALQMVFGGAFLVLASGVNGDFSRSDYSQVSMSSSLAMLYLIIFASLIGYSIFFWLIASVSATAANTYSYVSPVISIFLGWLILQEKRCP